MYLGGNRNFRKLPNKFIPRLIVSVIIAAVIGTLVTVIYISVNKKIHNSNTTTAMIDNWKKKELPQTLLTFRRGFRELT